MALFLATNDYTSDHMFGVNKFEKMQIPRSKRHTKTVSNAFARSMARSALASSLPMTTHSSAVRMAIGSDPCAMIDLVRANGACVSVMRCSRGSMST